MNLTYEAFLERKSQLRDDGGFEPGELPSHLFNFQAHLVEWAVRSGRGAIFADCGLGKTPMALAWADQVAQHTGKPVLLLTPLAVGFQIVNEAEKFGHDAALSRDGSVPAQITVTNYEQLVAGKFEPHHFGGVICDESSAIKAFDGTTRAVVTEFMRRIPYRLLATATAAPNDFTELGTSSEALGRLGHVDMLTRFFTNKNRTGTSNSRDIYGIDGERGVSWRLKGHAEESFWRWVASWARAVRKPSDLGFSNDGYSLPDLVHREHIIEASRAAEGALFDVPAHGLREEREEARRTIGDRAEKAAELLQDAEHAVAWCQLNDESTALTKLIDGAVEVSGADSTEAKEEKLAAFTRGDIRVLVTKPSIGAWGLNWQHCHRMTYFPSHSYEQYYQAVRRSWRFGQQNPVTVDIVTSVGGTTALSNLQRKAAQADDMFARLTAHMRDALDIRKTDYDMDLEKPQWLTQ